MAKLINFRDKSKSPSPTKSYITTQRVASIPILSLRPFPPPVTMSGSNAFLSGSPEPSRKMRTTNGANGTIRSVPSDSLQLDIRSSGESSRSSTKPDSPMPPSISIPVMNGKPPLAWQNSKQLGIGGGTMIRKISAEFGSSKLYTGNPHVVENGSSNNNTETSSQELNQAENRCSCGHGTSRTPGGGKSTSAFIEKVVNERDFFKRELDAEKLKTREANDALDFARAKMDQIISDHDAELHEANVNKTLLKRKERQLEDMKGKIEVEKQRASAAVEQENVWKRDMDIMREECHRRVDDAQEKAMRIEVQNNLMEQHWSEKKKEVIEDEKAMLMTHKAFVEEVRKDSDKVKQLEAICDQYRAENERLSKINAEQKLQHEEYKATNEEFLQSIKRSGADFNAKADGYLEEASELRDKLAWSLQVSKEFKDLPSSVDRL